MKSIIYSTTVYWNDCPHWTNNKTTQRLRDLNHRKINSEAETQGWKLRDPKTFHDGFHSRQTFSRDSYQ